MVYSNEIPGEHPRIGPGGESHVDTANVAVKRATLQVTSDLGPLYVAGYNAAAEELLALRAENAPLREALRERDPEYIVGVKPGYFHVRTSSHPDAESLCWRLLETITGQERACILERGHDDGIHEATNRQRTQEERDVSA